MKSREKLILIKTIHTLIWLFFNAVLFYMAYAVIINNINYLIWWGIGSIVIEWIVLLSFGWQCPFTILARKYSNAEMDNFDIYLPNWLAKYNKQIYITFFCLIMIGLVFRLLT
jgi:hypothetical protein